MEKIIELLAVADAYFGKPQTDERQKEAVRLDRIGNLVPLLRQMADIAGFEIMGRIPLRDKATGKEYR